MTGKISVRLVGGRADGQTVEVENMRDGWPFRAAVFDECAMDSPTMTGPDVCTVEARFHYYKLATVCSGDYQFRFGIPQGWDERDAFAHLFGPSYFRS